MKGERQLYREQFKAGLLVEKPAELIAIIRKASSVEQRARGIVAAGGKHYEFIEVRVYVERKEPL